MVKYAQNELFSTTDFTKQIESVVNNIKEHTQIYNLVQSRKDTPLSDYISMEDMAKKFNIDLDKI